LSVSTPCSFLGKGKKRFSKRHGRKDAKLTMRSQLFCVAAGKVRTCPRPRRCPGSRVQLSGTPNCIAVRVERPAARGKEEESFWDCAWAGWHALPPMVRVQGDRQLCCEAQGGSCAAITFWCVGACSGGRSLGALPARPGRAACLHPCQGVATCRDAGRHDGGELLRGSAWWRGPRRDQDV
jgi:hypothetical protein